MFTNTVLEILNESCNIQLSKKTTARRKTYERKFNACSSQNVMAEHFCRDTNY